MHAAFLRRRASGNSITGQEATISDQIIFLVCTIKMEANTLEIESLLGMCRKAIHC